MRPSSTPIVLSHNFRSCHLLGARPEPETVFTPPPPPHATVAALIWLHVAARRVVGETRTRFLRRELLLARINSDSMRISASRQLITVAYDFIEMALSPDTLLYDTIRDAILMCAYSSPSDRKKQYTINTKNTTDMLDYQDDQRHESSKSYSGDRASLYHIANDKHDNKLTAE